MEELTPTPSVRRQITSLLTILGGGILAACLFAGYMLYTYGPTGQYLLSNVLLDPAIAQSLAFNDSSLGRGEQGRLLLDSFQYRTYNKKGQYWDNVRISADKYSAIYHLLQNDYSLTESTQNLDKEFFNSKAPSIAIYVRSPNNQEPIIFQEVAFLPQKNLYRVGLRGKDSIEQFAYFSHPQAYEKIMKILEDR